MGASILRDSLAPLAPEQKAGLVVGSNRGSRLFVFDKNGNARLRPRHAAAAWTESESAAIRAAIAEAGRRYRGPGSRAWSGRLSGYALSVDLPRKAKRPDVEAAAGLLREELARRGVPAKVHGRFSSGHNSYLTAVRLTSPRERSFC